MEHELDYEHRLTELAEQIKSSKKRIDALERSTDALNRLATSVEVLAIKQDNMLSTLDRLDGKVETLEGKSGKRWDGLMDKLFWALFAAAIGYILAQFGL